MALRLSMARAGVLMPSKVRQGAEVFSAYSEPGPWSTYSMRQRYTIFLKTTTDPMIGDYFYEKWLHNWAGDVPSYNYWFVSSVAVGLALCITSRHLIFNPDVYVRRQEFKKPMPDRHRQWSYSMPYFNHRCRNWSAKYRWAFIDNEPDWIDHHPLGYRPHRVQYHRRPWWQVFTVPRYWIEDPLFTSTLHANFKKIYEDVGYCKKEEGEEEEE